MNKINFEDYPSLNTPLSAQNLNLMQDNIDNAIDNTTRAITAIANSQDITIATEWIGQKIPITLFNKNTDNLSVNNDDILIGQNINYIEVSCNLSYNASNFVNKELDIYLSINNRNVLATFYNKPANAIETKSVSPILLEVNEGDRISLNVIGGIASSYRNLISTLTVKVIS